MNVFSIEKESLIDVYNNHSDTITSIELDPKEKYFITGSRNGECKFWKIQYDIKKFVVLREMHDHEAEVKMLNLRY